MQAEKKADQINEKFSLIEGIYKKEDLLSGTNNGQGKYFIIHIGFFS